MKRTDVNPNANKESLEHTPGAEQRPIVENMFKGNDKARVRNIREKSRVVDSDSDSDLFTLEGERICSKSPWSMRKGYSPYVASKLSREPETPKKPPQIAEEHVLKRMIRCKFNEILSRWDARVARVRKAGTWPFDEEWSRWFSWLPNEILVIIGMATFSAVAGTIYQYGRPEMRGQTNNNRRK